MIPLRVDRRLKHTPWVNIALIAANAAVFLATRRQIELVNVAMVYDGVSAAQAARDFPVYGYYLRPFDPQWYQFFTYQFLHGDFMHLFGNMLFLWVFGNSLEDRFGSFGYLCYYLAAGVIAGVGHSLAEPNPVIGASGAVAGVTGGFLALFPLSHVTVLWPFLIITFFEWPSIYFILLAFARDVFYQFADIGGVAYLAHISGNVFGFAVGMGLLAGRILPREPYDLLALLDRWNRRRRFRSLAAQGAAPWQAQATTVLGMKKLTEEQEEVLKLRAAVQQALRVHDSDGALAAYERLVKLDPAHVLPRQVQLDLGALATSAARYALAAAAYEAFRNAYPKDDAMHEVNLILGLVYGRYLQDPAKARPLLQAARDRHADADRRALAEDLLAEIN